MTKVLPCECSRLVHNSQNAIPLFHLFMARAIFFLPEHISSAVQGEKGCREDWNNETIDILFMKEDKGLNGIWKKPLVFIY